MIPALDYASRTGDPPRRVVTPAQRRRRRAIAFAVVLCLIPYPTLVFPALTLRFVDAAGRPFDLTHPVQWNGVTNVDSIEGSVRPAPNAPISLPARRVWASLASRLLARLEIFIPHGGRWGDTYGTAYFDLSDNEALDAQAMSLAPVSTPPLPSWRLGPSGDTIRVGPSSSSRSAVVIKFDRLGAGARSYTIVLRHTTPLAVPATQPIRGLPE